MVKFDGAILKITLRQNLNRCMTRAVMKHLWLLLVLLLLLLLLKEASCISHRTEAAWGPAVAVLIIALKLLQSPAAAAAAILIIARKLLQSPTAAAAVLIIARKLLLLLRKNSYVYGNVIVPRGIILLTLQIINRTIRSN